MTALVAFFIGSNGAGETLIANKNGDASAEGFAPPFNQTLTTNSVTVSVSGGSGIYTHSWAFVSGNNVFAISDATASTVNWTANVGVTPRSAVWRDTVSDGVTFVTVDVNVTAQLS